MTDMQSQGDLSYVRQEILKAAPPPMRVHGVWPWMRANLFGSVGDTILSIVGAVIALWVIIPLLQWTLFDATWSGTRETCAANTVGACWAFVKANFGQFIYGRYPDPERWRVNLFFVLMAAGIIPLAIPSAPFKGWNLLYIYVVFPVVGGILLVGGVFGRPLVETQVWGGLFLTLVVSYVGMAMSLPLGILLALGRRSKMPAVHYVCLFFIELCRGVPLITVLFMAGILLPLFLPTGVNFDKLLRALLGLSLFAAAYMAEVIRGGLQAIPKGQFEGAMAVGLNYPQMMRLIILPQALKITIPNIVNTFIGLFKDTTLVSIVGLFDFLTAIEASRVDPKWAAPTTSTTGYAVAAIFYFIFCYGMSRYARATEARLAKAERR